MTTWGGPKRDEVEKYAELAAGPNGKPQPCITRISVPRFGDGGVQRLHSRMKEPGPESEPEVEI